MARELQHRVTAVMEQGLGARLQREVSIPWVARPDPDACGRRWPTVTAIYAALTDGLILPEDPPPVARRVDILIETDRGSAIVEVDETQHFNRFRAATIDCYPQDVRVAFPLDEWRDRSINKRKLEGGGFSRGRPLFRMEDGRHRQRAFRDAMTDLIPPEHGLRPTIRLASWELDSWIWGDAAAQKLADMMSARTGEAWQVRGEVPPAAMQRPAVRLAREPVQGMGDVSAGTVRTQRITAADLAAGQIRLPRETKMLFPPEQGIVSIVLRGRSIEAPYNPRTGPDRERSSVLRVPRQVLQSLVEPDEVLDVTANETDRLLA